MGLRDRIAQFLKYAPIDTKIKEKLPFVWLLGYEKTYGKVEPQDFTRQVESYKSWVYACAWKNATSVAKCKLRLYTTTMNEDGDEELNNVGQHPFLDVIKSVNPFSNRFELFTITQLYLELTGNAYWWIPRNALGVPYMIWNIPSHWMRIVPDVKTFISGYVMRVPNKGQYIPFDETDIVHFKSPSPFDLYYGTGPTFAAQFGIDLNEQVKTWGINYFLNNAQPSGVLSTDTSLSTEEYQRLRDRWNEKYRGAVNAGKMAILENGLKYQQVGSTVRDARLETITTEVRDEICAIFGVPASKLGLTENVNRANADANDYTYQRETILPRLTLMEEKLNEKFVSIYDKGLICRFDSPVQQDDAVRATERQTNISCGYSSIDEERIKDGLEPYNLPETSVPLIPFNLTPAGTPKPAMDSFGNPTDTSKSLQKKKDQKWNIFATTTHPQEKQFQGVMQRYFQKQHGEMIKKLNRFKSVNKDLFSHIMFNMNDEKQDLKNKSKANIKEAYITGLKLGMNDTNHSIDFTLFEPNILRAVESRINFFAEKVNQTTANLLREQLDEGFQNGESISDIASRIDSVFSFNGDFRAKRVAQTEVIGATNDGQLRAYDEAGVKRKEWISAGDEKVRDSHRIDGQVVDLHQAFTTGDGNKLLYPGDRSSGADPSDTINCRCTVLPVI